MDAMDAILSRRSIRKYTKEPVPEKVLKEILDAAMSAPSAGNQQPWHFVVINNREILDEIPNFHPYSHALKMASVAILVCGDLELEQHKDFWVQDCSAATENILVAVHAKELGAVWLGLYPRAERVAGMRALLGIPDHVVPLAIIPIGYPAEEKPPAMRFNASRIHYNKW
ncbi:MAG TPA: nitroreductase family protein [Syntrophaceae bacterium]|jgi:nitroreductase|nr:nitroreductase family protein [Syntrophaceae bacterium]